MVRRTTLNRLGKNLNAAIHQSERYVSDAEKLQMIGGGERPVEGRWYSNRSSTVK